MRIRLVPGRRTERLNNRQPNAHAVVGITDVRQDAALDGDELPLLELDRGNGTLEPGREQAVLKHVVAG